LRVKSFLDPHYPKVSPEDLLTHARAVFRDLALRMLPVVNRERKLEGVLTRESVLALSSTRSNALVRDVMDNPPLSFKPDEDAFKAFEVMIEFDEWYVPVVDEARGRFQGVLSLDSFLRYIIRRDHPAHSTPVEEVMNREVEFFTPEEFIAKVWRKMTQLRFSGFPVVKGKNRVVVGIITQHDLLRKGYTRIELESDSGPRPGPKVKEAMNSPAITVNLRETLKDATFLMVKRDIGRIPVVNDKGELQGLIDRSDACSFYLKSGGSR